FFSTNHKDIGILYFIFAIRSGNIGSAINVLFRSELGSYRSLINNYQIYNSLITNHAFIIIFFILILPGLISHIILNERGKKIYMLFSTIFIRVAHFHYVLSIFSLISGSMVRLILFRIINYLNNLLAHLTPLGTLFILISFILIPFIVIIESISLIIRSFTLAIRLTANIIAGHLILTLLGSSRTNIFNPAILLILISIQILLYTLYFEIAVSLIQALFSILSTLYKREA
ncbi:ATP6 synthase, partial [Acromyrmex heyeri]